MTLSQDNKSIACVAAGLDTREPDRKFDVVGDLDCLHATKATSQELENLTQTAVNRWF